MIGVRVDVAAAHDGDDVPAGEAVAVFQDGRDAERGRRLDDQASMVEQHPHAGEGHPRLTITNTGPVIPAGQASRLLQPFQRLSASRTADDEGIGLGLSIVAAIAKAHHATLTITPVPHGGLDIEISFPATAAIVSARDKALAAT